MLYIENKTAKIAVKLNGQLTERVIAKDVEMQGSAWGKFEVYCHIGSAQQIITTTRTFDL